MAVPFFIISSLLAFIFMLPLAAQPLVRMHTNVGDIDVQLAPASAPATVANFLSYANRGAYNNSIIHRSVANFIIQGGGFTQNGTAIPTDRPVRNEFGIPNTRGTIAMAKVGGDPNSATDQWFFNEADNRANLDNQNGGFTVFGTIANAAGLAVMDQISALGTVNGGGAFTQLPLLDTAQPALPANLVTVLSVTQLGVGAVTANGGSGQSAPVNTAFAAPFQVLVTNGSGVASPGVAVTFTAPASGASGSFIGNAPVITNALGVAIAPAFVANDVPGSYNVVATVNSIPATFSLTNTALKTNVGYLNNGSFVLDANGTGAFDAGDKNFFYAQQQPGDIAVTGDWNGDGHSKAGIYRNGFWILDYNGNGVYDPPADKFYGFGGATAQSYRPIVGDWNGDGRSKIGYYLNGFWVLDYNGNGIYDGTGAGQDRFYAFGGNPNEFPLVGDWNRDGRAKVGTFSNGTFTLDYNGDGAFGAVADRQFSYLSYTAGDIPLVGDWNADGASKVGIYRKGFWILDFNGNGVYDYPTDKFYGFGGNTGEVPVVGDWNGDGKGKIGLYLNGFWILDFNGNGSFDGTAAGQDRFIAFGGNAGEQPIIGRW